MNADEIMAEIPEAIGQVQDELERALKLHGEFRSLHEGYAVLLEEVDELWDEIKKKRSIRDNQKMNQEALQVAAMAVKLMMLVHRNTSP